LPTTIEHDRLPQRWLAELAKAMENVSTYQLRGEWTLKVIESYVHPAGVPDDQWLESFRAISDHRPVVTRFALEQSIVRNH